MKKPFLPDLPNEFIITKFAVDHLRKKGMFVRLTIYVTNVAQKTKTSFIVTYGEKVVPLSNTFKNLAHLVMKKIPVRVIRNIDTNTVDIINAESGKYDIQFVDGTES